MTKGIIRSTIFGGLASLAAGSLAAGQPARAEEAAPAPSQTWAVTGVTSDDVLHMRDVPHGDSKILADIPPTAKGLKGFGCITPEPSFDRWAEMTADERANAKLPWCRVEYRGHQGWVAARFLKPDR
ncbi:MAG: hypothetical protein K2Y42_11565 [Hyphomicrobium sp.]|jgi:hypothetical protein|uniref:hypothetical protein n=1 Tax=Hyphomicrobium sp. TaxID=82 RepID=UPI0025BA4FC5|nr:hypothetical protein [Hyphomicrobium sp.]MBX9863379.1 hypothetical protein [Hyphomicrobium sp.]